MRTNLTVCIFESSKGVCIIVTSARAYVHGHLSPIRWDILVLKCTPSCSLRITSDRRPTAFTRIDLRWRYTVPKQVQSVRTTTWFCRIANTRGTAVFRVGWYSTNRKSIPAETLMEVFWFYLLARQEMRSLAPYTIPGLLTLM